MNRYINTILLMLVLSMVLAAHTAQAPRSSEKNTEIINNMISSDSIASITVYPSATTTLTVGGIQEFNSTTRNQSGNPMAGIDISWTVSNSAVGYVIPITATTDAAGKAFTTFHAVSQGTIMVNATNGSVKGISSVIVVNFPAVSNPTTSHEIPDDTDNEPLWGETAQLNVTVTGASGIASVTVNLSKIGGPSSKQMINVIGNIYSTTTNASAGTPPKLYNLTVNATDIYGKSNTSVSIQLKVMKNGDCTGNNVVNIGDALRLANNVSYYGNPAYALISPYVCEVTGNGVINIGDALRLANNVSYPGNMAYILK